MMLPTLFMITAGLAAAAGVHRLINGPTRTDRVIGLDLLFAIAIVFCMTAAWMSQSTVYLDVAIGLALTGTVATLSWARLIQIRAEQDGTKQAGKGEWR
ncbi:MAG: monovalent cation/H+ antiporter complex subunit F [Pirellulales bacterium]|nr:monovalent cation/H+ antiporter complex subunit F [Pirellulales bacterium]